MQSVTVFFWYNKKWRFPVKKWWSQQSSRGLPHKLYTFWIFFRRAKSHYRRTCVTDFMEGDLCHPTPLPHSCVSTPKNHILNKVNNRSVKISFQKTFFLLFYGDRFIKSTFQTEISILTFQWWEELLMHNRISLLSILFLSKEFHKLLYFHLFKKLVLPDETVITLVIFQWCSTKKLYCCGLNVQI